MITKKTAGLLFVPALIIALLGCSKKTEMEQPGSETSTLEVADLTHID